MNSRSCFFSKEHILSNRFHTSAELTEQALHCLELVSELSDAGLEYQFKGGNSLLLILDHPQRFSIDVDIATDASAGDVEAVLNEIVKRFGVFTRWGIRQHKTKPWIALSSYYCYYNSLVSDEKETNIMLDVQLHTSPYHCERKTVTCGTLYESDSCVTLPLPSSIVGDKLLTLGPETLGIPVGKGKGAQRLKHVFDVSRLLDMKPSLEGIRESFRQCLDFENGLQKRTPAISTVIQDTLANCYSVVHYDEPPESVTDSLLREHVEGLQPFTEHLFRETYSWKDLQHDMARVACCIAAVGSHCVTEEQFDRVFSDDTYQVDVPVGAFLRENATARRYWEFIASWEDTRDFFGGNLMQ
jgi:hypothetical protein